MRKLIVLVLLLPLFICTKAQENKRLATLQTCLQEVQQNPADSALQRKFFNAFPNNFPDLLVSLGYTSFSEPLVDYVNCVQTFSQLTHITDKEKMIRLRNVMIGGFWQADGIGMTFHLMKELMQKQPQLAFDVVAELPTYQQILFWQCYWQNPCNDSSLEKDFQLFTATKGHKEAQQIMKQAYQTFKGELPIIIPIQ